MEGDPSYVNGLVLITDEHHREEGGGPDLQRPAAPLLHDKGLTTRVLLHGSSRDLHIRRRGAAGATGVRNAV